MPRKITHIFIHCTGASPEQTVASIRAYWKNIMGWKSVGYHHLISANGTDNVLADDEKVTNGVAGYNSGAINLCYIGGKQDGEFKDTRTQEQKAMLEKLVRHYTTKYPDAKVLGHRDISPDKNKNGKVDTWEYIKSCPCFDVKTWLTEIGIQPE